MKPWEFFRYLSKFLHLGQKRTVRPLPLKCLLPVLFLFSLLPVLEAQFTETGNPYYRFQRITKKEGLSSNHILDIFQDKSGFMWFATDHGLNRYDGYSITKYFHNGNDNSSLSGNIITGLAEDTAGNLWIGTDKGLDRFIRVNNKFKHLIIGTPNNPKSRQVRALHIDKKNVFWIETADGFLSRMNVASGKYQRFMHEKPGQIDKYLYHSIFEYPNGKIWIGGRAMGPYYFNEKTGILVFYPSKPENPFGKDVKDITCFYRDREDDFWVAGVDGLYRFDTINKRFYKFLSGSVFDIKESKDGELWIGTGNGLKIWDRDKHKLTSIQQDVENASSLPNNHITKLFFDRSGCLWIGTIEGLAKYSFFSNKFQTYFHIPGNINTPSSSYITALLEDIDSNIWIGTDDAGIDVFDRNFNKTAHFDTYSPTIPLASNRISVMYEDKTGNIWIGLWSGTGFQKIDRKRKNIRLFRLDSTSRKMDWYNGFCEDNIGNFWVASWSSYGLFRFNNNIFVDKRNKPGCPYPLGSHFVSFLMKDKDGLLWVGSTDAGLSRMNPEDKSIKIFTDNQDDSTGFWGINVSCIFQDREGIVWVGGYGLNRFWPENNSFSHYTVENGIADNKIMGILEDDNQRLWISTASGLSVLDKTKNTFFNFFKKDGLPANEFTRAACRLSDGRLLFGTKRGLVMVYPHRIAFNKIAPQPMLSSIRIFEEPLPFNYASRHSLKLNYKQNYVSFIFSASDYNFPIYNRYAYKLVNYDREWNYCNAVNRKAKYTHLHPGSYQFLLKVANSDGLWAKKPLRLNLEISSPYWKTGWFILLEILFLLSLVVSFILYREKRIKLNHKAELLEQKLLRTQMNPHFIFNALSAIQSYIFSHDALESASYLSKFASLMRSILYSSRVEFISLEEEIEILRNYLMMQQLRFENKFEYSFDIDSSLNIEGIMVPPMLSQPFIENAIEHGFKDKNKKGYIKIKVAKQGEFLLIRIEDNGVGIDTTNKHKDIKHRSMAVEITKERLQLLNRGSRKRYSYIIEVMKGAKGDVIGTLISYFIPLNKKQ